MAGLSRARRDLEHRPRADSLSALAGEFTGFDFGTCRTREGTALTAQRRDASEPGVFAVITPDVDEMRAALTEDLPPDSG